MQRCSRYQSAHMKAAARNGYNNRCAAFEYHGYENLMNVYGVAPVHR